MVRVASVLVSFTVVALAQHSTEFDTISIRSHTHGGEISSSWNVASASLQATGQSLAELVERAYGVKQFQVISRGPAWINTYRFDIEARTTIPASEPEMMEMLRGSLSKYFHLVLRREERSISVFSLEVASNGPKLTPATFTDGPTLTGDNGEIVAKHISMDEFADALSQFLTKRPVLNRTNLHGEYQFHLKFAPRATAGSNNSIFEAMPQQLGLRLRSATATIKVLIIDRAIRPAQH